MEENKYLCPECGTEMIENYEKPSLLLYCPKCGCKLATTRWDAIDLDETNYELLLEKIESPSIESIKIISSLTGQNFIETRTNLINGNVSFIGCALEIMEKKKICDDNNIKYFISPAFPY